jgi:hypothetical protein
LIFAADQHKPAIALAAIEESGRARRHYESADKNIRVENDPHMALLAKSFRTDGLQGLVNGGFDLLRGNAGIGGTRFGNGSVQNTPADSFLNKPRQIAVRETVLREVVA